MGVGRAFRLGNQNASMCHQARPQTPRGQKLLCLKPHPLHLAVDSCPLIAFVIKL